MLDGKMNRFSMSMNIETSSNLCFAWT